MWAKWNCRRVQAKLWEYGAGDLPEVEQCRVQAHIERCPACRNRLAVTLDTASIVRSLRTCAVPNSETDFQDLLVRLHSRRKRPATALPRAAVSLVTVAAAGALVVCGLMLRRHASHSGVSAGPEPRSRQVVGDSGVVAAKTEPEGGEIALSGLYPILSAIGRMQSVPTGTHPQNPLHYMRAGYDRVKLYATQGWSGRKHHLAHRLKQDAKTIYADAMSEEAALVSAAALQSGEQPQPESKPRAFVMPVVGNGAEGAVRRAYVMDGIPTQTATGAAAEAQNPDAGRAL